ncbi:antibiotic biosynthesis monooxygenase [Phormidesmis priestleyi ULC007]|uniref:Antibiotic biosynthesis monooxygenase n=1 Tax=Phormidesmis priestleyi ULC007 TaxID=1920490 RepID=A0A2T1DCS9_9CYAN|nr:antibiotic biosynthesis monooxygenase [Phormidesmis priestleyi]PSB18254.1 antibiotic biosynthesis monooxygenase [Phormidesmis priestleyi ULC007]PZO49525.1 MAG: antibiotic biosynthesis monooxygenase [Phormidesmis priestleyi]
MTDFQDFLIHKCAQVAIGEFKPGTFEAAQQLYQEAVAMYAEGFLGAYLLREKDTDRGISVIFWESEALMEANSSEAHQAILKKMTPLFSAVPMINAYEIVSEILPKE